ncbi:MAG: hypothetical protein HDR26_08965 [Lachnospiraceae bacterium]|nr:hypothetical protein [Lachnospiraceae bacterium]
MKKHKKMMIAVVSFVVLVFVYVLCVRADFNRKGIASGMRGLVSEDTYPNWASDREVSELDCNVLDRSGLSLSRVYLIRRAGYYQVRLRIGRTVPFTQEDLIGDIRWIVEDQDGSSFTNSMTVYAERIGWINCVNVTLVLDESEYSSLTGGKITFSAVCQDSENPDSKDSYAHCEAEIDF